MLANIIDSWSRESPMSRTVTCRASEKDHTSRTGSQVSQTIGCYLSQTRPWHLRDGTYTRACSAPDLLCRVLFVDHGGDTHVERLAIAIPEFRGGYCAQNSQTSRRSPEDSEIHPAMMRIGTIAIPVSFPRWIGHAGMIRGHGVLATRLGSPQISHDDIPRYTLDIMFWPHHDHSVAG